MEIRMQEVVICELVRLVVKSTSPDKLAAIKLVRVLTGFGLRMSKDLVEAALSTSKDPVQMVLTNYQNTQWDGVGYSSASDWHAAAYPEEANLGDILKGVLHQPKTGNY